jgi:hypothetical protein
MEQADDADIFASLVVLMDVDGGAISTGIIGGVDRLVMMLLLNYSVQMIVMMYLRV